MILDSKQGSHHGDQAAISAGSSSGRSINVLGYRPRDAGQLAFVSLLPGVRTAVDVVRARSWTSTSCECLGGWLSGRTTASAAAVTACSEWFRCRLDAWRTLHVVETCETLPGTVV
ncbi:MAG: hypothetical protein CL859_08500 [Cyanobium sp. ARS6]|uniref:hypothetical protein n=1 Tax=unclassified Synechococcus TaxID=2626047 RepID=UPI000C57725A|nr:hypothetical protein [Cyanobium sp. ARS6]